MSEDLKTRIQQSQDRCKDLLSKYDRRLAMQANITASEGFQRFADDRLRTSVPEPILVDVSLIVCINGQEDKEMAGYA